MFITKKAGIRNERDCCNSHASLSVEHLQAVNGCVCVTHTVRIRVYGIHTYTHLTLQGLIRSLIGETNTRKQLGDASTPNIRKHGLFGDNRKQQTHPIDNEASQVYSALTHLTSTKEAVEHAKHKKARTKIQGGDSTTPARGGLRRTAGDQERHHEEDRRQQMAADEAEASRAGQSGAAILSSEASVSRDFTSGTRPNAIFLFHHRCQSESVPEPSDE